MMDKMDNMDTLPYEAGIDGVPLTAFEEECGGGIMGIVFPCVPQTWHY